MTSSGKSLVLAHLAVCFSLAACQGHPSAGAGPEEATKHVEARLGGAPRWDTEATLTPSQTDGIKGDSFGTSLAISGDTALIGAPGDAAATGTPRTADNTGSAYFFQRTLGVWAQQTKVFATDATAGDNFGARVAIGATLAVVSSRFGSYEDPGAGAVYVYARSGASWAGDGPPLVGSNTEQFGYSVAVSSDRILVGAPNNGAPSSAPGSAYLFTKGDAGWTLDRTLSAPNPEQYDGFGSGVALNEDVAIVGAPGIEGGAGAAYVFSLSDLTAPPSALEAADRQIDGGDDSFGLSVSISNKTIAVAASSATGGPDSVTALLNPAATGTGAPFAGAVYVFVGGSAGWSEQQKLFFAEGAEDDLFGHSVGLDGDALVTESANVQSAFVFTRSANVWGAPQKITAPSRVDNFAQFVAISGKTALIGTPNGSTPGGAVALGLSDGSECNSDSDCAHSSCSDGVCCDKPCNGTCESCLAIAKTSGVDGTCGPAKETSNPGGKCVAESASTCGTIGTCDGLGNCALFDAGTECAPATCSAPGTVQASACDGAGHCKSADSDCNHFVCADGACLASCASAQDCVQGAFCNKRGTCEQNHSPTCTLDGTGFFGTDGTTITSCGLFQCAAGACLTKCSSNSDCAMGLGCRLGDQQCVPTCGSASDCPDGGACNADHQCSSSCSSAQECLPGSNCSPSQHVCTQAAECSASTDCAAGSGCSSVSGLCSKPCSSASDCSDGDACSVVDHFCNTSCSSAQDCPTGLNCGPSQHVCTTALDCSTSADCVDGHSCSASTQRCAPNCASASDCPDGDACALSDHLCSSTCASAKDCQAGLACSPDNHQCTADLRCVSSADCPDGLDCGHSQKCTVLKPQSTGSSGCSCRIPSSDERRNAPTEIIAFLGCFVVHWRRMRLHSKKSPRRRSIARS